MRWTLWLTLFILCGIYGKLIESTVYDSVMVIAVLIISGLALFIDYVKERKE